jgi:hypothetical protein
MRWTKSRAVGESAVTLNVSRSGRDRSAGVTQANLMSNGKSAKILIL